MRVLHAFVGLCLGAVLGLTLLIAGGLQTPAAPACPHCAVLAQPYGGCNEAVANGWVCP